MSSEAPEPPDITRPNVSKPIAPGEERLPQDTTRPFSTFMEGKEPNPLMETGKTPQVSPFDLAHGKVPAPGPTITTIQEQAKAAQSTMGDLVNQLKTPKLKLKQSTKYLLKNKLNSAKGHIKSASDKLGAPLVGEEEEEAPKGTGPLGKFIGLVTSGQYQLQQTQDQLAKIAAKGKDMRPADMLMVQIKLSKAQQELEYSSLLLGKAVDDLKMMMNIQL